MVGDAVQYDTLGDVDLFGRSLFLPMSSYAEMSFWGPISEKITKYGPNFFSSQNRVC
jgi:hypothetical protein